MNDEYLKKVLLALADIANSIDRNTEAIESLADAVREAADVEDEEWEMPTDDEPEF